MELDELFEHEDPSSHDVRDDLPDALTARAVLDSLPPRYRRILRLRYYEGCSIAEDRGVARREAEVRAEAGVEVHQEGGEKLLGERKNGMPPSPAQARLAEFLETAERLKNERAAAGGGAGDGGGDSARCVAVLATYPEFQTNAALEKLSEEVRRRLDRNPREALALAELATTIADALPPTAYPAVTLAQIRAMAWKDRANALRFLGRIPETFEAIARAEEILDKHVALGLDRAVVDLVKALALLNTGDVEQARAIAITCGSVFLSHGDLTRALNAGEIEGHVLYEMERYADGYTLFKSLIDVARAANDAEAEARSIKTPHGVLVP